MAEAQRITLKICDWVKRYSLFALIFLLPIFFLPWTSEVLDSNKQALLILLSFVALIAWMLKVLVLGKLRFNASKIHIATGVLFFVYAASTFFSVNGYGSFWGWPLITSESLLSLICIGIVYFIISNTFSKKDVFISVILLLCSVLLAEIFGVLQLLGVFLFSFSFAKLASFNTIGSVGSLGVTASILLPLFMVLLIVAKKWWKIIFAVGIAFSALILIIINYPIIWWTVIASSVAVIIFGILKKDLFDGKWIVLPVFFLIVSIFFILINPQIKFLSQRPNEIFLSQKSGVNIALQAIKERPIFGSGPGTFYYDFSKFKDSNLSKGSLWNITFNLSSSKVLNDLAATGVFGLIALLCFMAFPIFYGVKFLVSKKISDQEENQGEKAKLYWILTFGISIALITQTVAYFLHNSNITLGFINFLMVASLVVLITENKKEYELRPSSFLILAVTFIFTLIFIFGTGLLILEGQRYASEVKYSQGIASWQAGNKDEGIKNLEAAANLNAGSDLYFMQLSQMYLISLQEKLNGTTLAILSGDEKSEIQTLEANSVNAAKIATDLNPNSSNNWASRGYIYQNLNSLIGDSLTWATNSYEKALELDPNNLYVLSQASAVDFVTAEALSPSKADQKKQLLASAKTKLEKAVSLNPNYSNALYYLGLVYDATDQRSKAIEQFEKLQKLNPEDTNIPKILANISAGLPPLQTSASSLLTDDSEKTSPAKTLSK